MAWPVIDRKTVSEDQLGQGLSAPAKEKIRAFFSRYPTKRAVALAALRIAQEEIGYVSWRTMRDIAELLELPAAEIMNLVSFYTHFWTHPKGRKTIVVCRSLSCELMGQKELLAALKTKLGIEEHGTTADGEYSLMTEECLAACDYAPCMLINEKMHKCVRVEDLDRILADPHNDKLDVPRSDLYDAPAHGQRQA